MKLYIEVNSRKNLKKAEEYLKSLDWADGIDIPDSPLGEPSVPPILTACVARRVMEERKKVIINQRLADVNELYIESLAKGAKALNASIVFTRGDRPKVGREVGYLTSEAASSIVKSKYGVEVGLMVSMAKGLDEVKRRLDLPADFFLVLRLANAEQLEGLDTSRTIPYVVILTERNDSVVKAINQPFVHYRELPEYLTSLEDIGVMGVLLSAPGDDNFIKELYKFL